MSTGLSQFEIVTKFQPRNLINLVKLSVKAMFGAILRCDMWLHYTTVASIKIDFSCFLGKLEAKN